MQRSRPVSLLGKLGLQACPVQADAQEDTAAYQTRLKGRYPPRWAVLSLEGTCPGRPARLYLGTTARQPGMPAAFSQAQPVNWLPEAPL